MRNYYFPPMMKHYRACVQRIPSRKALSRLLAMCRAEFGSGEACKLRDALIWVGSYPVR